MVKIRCKTSLDINEKWPTSLPERSIREFYSWYAPLIGKSVSYYI